MNINLSDFLISLSFVLDLVETEAFGSMTFHANRVAYISMKVARKIGLNDSEIFDMVSLGILHDNGIIGCETHNIIRYGGVSVDKKEALLRFESDTSHQIIGEKNVFDFPFLTDSKDGILYHHENFDGSGPQGILGDDIPLYSQIIRLADGIDLNFDLNMAGIEEKEIIRAYVTQNEGILFSPAVVEAFMDISSRGYFWIDLKDGIVNDSLQRGTPNIHMDISDSRIVGITGIFSRIIDEKSSFTGRHSKSLSEKVEMMCAYYGISHLKTHMMKTAALLHDVGKMAVSNLLLEKMGKLDKYEADLMHEHSYFTRLTLQKIEGFEDISVWASNHHERLDGKGYPLGLRGEELDFNSRLISCLDVYQALTEDRPYHPKFTDDEVREFLINLAESGGLDKKMVNDIIKVFIKK